MPNPFPRLAPLLFLLACQSAKQPETADQIFFNAQIFTANDAQPTATAIALRGDRILFVGDDAGAKKLINPNTQLTDLQGAFIMPGFIEGHGHFAALGRSLLNVNLLDTKSWSEIVQRTAERAAQTKPGDWLEGRGWHQEKWVSKPEKLVSGYPYHDELSAVTPNNPVILYHASGHSLFANAQAMQLAGISRETPDPLGGKIIRDASGKAVGVFEENAMDLIEQAYQKFKNQRSEPERRALFDKSIELATAECLKNGITSFEDAGSDFWEIDQYARLADAGKLGVRVWAMLSQPKKHDFARLSDFPKIGLGQNHFTCRAIKCYLDGALGSHGAWLLAEYSDKPKFFGQNTTPVDTIAEIAALCLKHNLQCCVHAIGDRGNREILNVYQKQLENAASQPTNRLTDQPTNRLPRWRIEHSQHLDAQDIPRFGQLGVVAAMQAIHCTSDAPFVEKRLGHERAKIGAYAWRSLLDSGAHVANGTDAPVEDVNPLPCLYAAVTRKRVDTGLEFFPEQSMTRREALLSYTIWNAWAAFEEDLKGSLAPGKLADLVVLDKNLLTCPVGEILQARVLKTIVGGQVKFERK